jgi:hypothetical protein
MLANNEAGTSVMDATQELDRAISTVGKNQVFRDGRFDAVCGKSPIFWPETQWPEHEVCADCKAWVEEHGTPVPMLYQTRPHSAGDARRGNPPPQRGIDAS